LIAFGAFFFASLGLAYYSLGVAASFPSAKSGTNHQLIFCGSIVYLTPSQQRLLDVLEGLRVAWMGLAALSFFAIRRGKAT
jgi:hypothetical protein